MKRLFFIIFAVCFGFAANAQLKFGYLDSQTFIESLPEYTKMQKTLEDETSKIESQLTTLQEEFTKMQQEAQRNESKMTEQEKTSKSLELQETANKIQEFVQNARKTLEERQRELFAPIFQKVQKAIQEVGDENGFIYIFESKTGIILHNGANSVDVAPLLKKKFSVN